LRLRFPNGTEIVTPSPPRARLDIRAGSYIVLPVMHPPLSPFTRFARNRRLTLRRGFTLLEILVVLAIIGLLAGLAITNVDKIFGGAQLSTVKIFVKESMKTSLTSYRIHMGDYPSTSDGLQALITAPGTKADKWFGPYIEGGKIPQDPWGEPYQYAYPGTRNKGSYDLWSKGPDKQSGTADDIGNWDASPGGDK
jgi:general secretion pathway protein G